MIPYKTIIRLDKKSCTPLYIQLCNQLIQLIKCGVLPPSSRLPGTRWMSDTLGIHRKTVIAAYDELVTQGWTEASPARGTFVNSLLPIVEKRPIPGKNGGRIRTKYSRLPASPSYIENTWTAPMPGFGGRAHRI